MSGELTEEQKIMLFCLRSKMLRVKSNFSGMFPGNKFCSLGCQTTEDESHMLSCRYLIEKLDDASVLAELEYSDVFKSVQTQKQISQMFIDLWKLRQKILSEV